MPKFFTYRTLDDLRADVSQLGVDISFEEDLQAVFRPVQIGSRHVGNALAIHPMEGTDSTPEGAPGELTFRRWRRYAAGGSKLFWGEATAVAEEGRANPRQLYLTEDTYDDFARLVEESRTVHKKRWGDDTDFLIGLQLTHSGRWSYQKPLPAVHEPVVDARTFVDRARGLTVDSSYPILSDDYLRALEEKFLLSAKLAARAGFDFIDLKQCHTYLLNELLGARTRPGLYGGSWENRTRFIRNVLTAIRSELPNLLLATRINVYDGVPFPLNGEPPQPVRNGFGLNLDNPLKMDLTEPLQFVSLLRDLGVAMVSISMGSPYFNPHLERPMEKPDAAGYPPPEHPLLGIDRHFSAVATLQKAHPDLPLVGAGYSWLRHFFIYAAEANLLGQKVTIVGTGRGSLAYPDMVADLLETGKLNPRKACIADSHCTDLMRAKNNELGQFPAGCATRDPVYAKIYKEAYPKK